MKKLLLIVFLLQSGVAFGMESENNQVPNFGVELDPASELKLVNEGDKIKYYINGEKKEIFSAWWYWSENRRDGNTKRAAKFWFNAEPTLSTLQLLKDCLGPDLFQKITVAISPSPPKDTSSDKPYSDKKSTFCESYFLWKDYLTSKGFRVYDHYKDHRGVEGVKFWVEPKKPALNYNYRRNLNSKRNRWR